MTKLFNQKGVLHTLPLLVIIAAVGIISFLLITSTLPLNGLFGKLNPKQSSHAATSQGTLSPMLNWTTPKIAGAGLVGDPVRPSDFYMFYETPGGNVGTNHVLKSTDYGMTWNQADQTTFNGNAWGVAIDPNPNRNPNTAPTLYAPAGYGNNGVWKSTDGGKNWGNLFDNSQYSTCLIPKKGGGTVAIPRDTNNGCMDFYQINVLPDNPPNHILVTYHYGLGQLLESSDGGVTWDVHKVPAANSDYVLGISATNWIAISQDNVGIYRTTTAGRDNNGNISQSAWNLTSQNESYPNQPPKTYASGLAHMHGNFTPYVDFANGDIYFAGAGGVVCSSDQGANWHLIMDGNASQVFGTPNYLYASFAGASAMWRLPKGCNNPTIDHNYYPLMTNIPSAWTSSVTPYGIATSYNGSNWIINMSLYNGGPGGNGEIWRFVEPPTDTTQNSRIIYDDMSGNLANGWADCSSSDEYTHYTMMGMGGSGMFTLHSGTWPNGFLGLCNTAGVNSANYQALDFNVLADQGNTGSDVNIAFRTVSGQTVTKPIDQYIQGGDTKLINSKWEHIIVPLSSLGLTDPMINRISFLATGTTQSILFMDALQFTPLSQPTPAPSACPKAALGDIDCNGKINLFDYSTLVTNFGKSVAKNTLGDLDGNGIVNLLDYSILVTNFGK